ncbi:MAG: threonine/serine dehydratase [Bacteroidota bacterium]|nr:threonine/serine dehydratase [Rhodothermia bacterium]MDW8285114.1 threonine/serine dehydratase [Bacteroidota bacterium]
MRFPTLEQIRQAHVQIQEVAQWTPTLTSSQLNRRTGNRLFFKAENFQRTGSFKVRGAFYKLSQLPEPVRQRGVITYSSGNHGQATAFAANWWGVPAVVVMPEDASQVKVAATRAYGAEIIFAGRTSEERFRRAHELAEAHGYAIVPPYDDPAIITGQGTVALELFEDVGDLHYLLVPVGGGGLIAGIALAAKALNPEVRIIGVETEAANDLYLSFQRGERVRISYPHTIADGMRNLEVGELNWAIIREHIDEVLTVSELEVIEAMRMLLHYLKVLVEPTGAVAAAAALSGRIPVRDKWIGVILSGGNVDLPRLGRWLLEDGAWP